MKKILFYSSCLLLVACTQTSTNYVARVKLLQLQASDIFNSRRVKDVIFDAEELNTDSLRKQSRLLFLQGLDAFRNKKDLVAAIAKFKQSILVLPDAKTYYELGNALLESGSTEIDFKEADKAYEVAEDLHFQPLSMVYYKKACVSTQTERENNWQTRYLLLTAFENGFSDTAMIRKEKYFHSFVQSPEYRDLMVSLALKRSKDQQEDLFTVYSKAFAPLPEHFEIKKEVVDMRDYKQFISYDFVKYVPEMQNSNFGRDVSHEFLYVGRLKESPIYTAVLYASMSYYGEFMQPVHTKLVTYDANGKMLSSLIIAGQFTAESIKSAKIDGSKIQIEEYKRIWEQPIDKVAFEENKVAKYELLAKAVYRLDESGKILEESVPENFHDSIPLAKQ